MSLLDTSAVICRDISPVSSLFPVALASLYAPAPRLVSLAVDLLTCTSRGFALWCMAQSVREMCTAHSSMDGSSPVPIRWLGASLNAMA